MTITLIEMSEDEFDKQFPLLKNHFNPNASWAYGDGPGCLFETYGEELEFVQRQDPGTVWTLVEGDDGGQYLVNGFHFVNRIGYLISTVALPEEINVEVRIPMQTASGNEIDEHESVLPQSAQQAGKIAEESLGLLLPGIQETRPVSPISPSPLLVPRGMPLMPGKMYLRLYHGRRDPDQDMDDWASTARRSAPSPAMFTRIAGTFASSVSRTRNSG